MDKKENTKRVCAFLAGKYNVKICDYDKTAIIVAYITEKQLAELCRELNCSGYYSDIAGKGIITNFGEYK